MKGGEEMNGVMEIVWWVWEDECEDDDVDEEEDEEEEEWMREGFG